MMFLYLVPGVEHLLVCYRMFQGQPKTGVNI